MTDQNNVSDLESLLLATLKSHPKGVTQNILMQALPSLSVKELSGLINKFLGQGKINLLKKGQQLIYAYKNDSRKSQGGDNEEKLILEAVQKSGSDGIAPKEIKYATNLPQPQITKILKTLEARRLVKSVVSCSKKKLFLLYGVEPSHAITGGTFYSGQEFETEFVDIIGEQCYQYLLQAKGLAEKLSDPAAQRHASWKSSRDICDYINNLKISKVELKLPDIEKILEALIYDNKLEKSVSLTNTSSQRSGAENFYRTVKPLIPSAGLMRMPCGVCPVYKECGEGLSVSPSTCIYLKEWLDL